MPPATDTIGRANLDGTGVNQSFIATAGAPPGAAVDRGHIYWVNYIASGTIGRANLDGTGVDQSFIIGAGGPCGVAVDSAHIYWANEGYGLGEPMAVPTSTVRASPRASSPPPTGRGVAVDALTSARPTTTINLSPASRDGQDR